MSPFEPPAYQPTRSIAPVNQQYCYAEKTQFILEDKITSSPHAQFMVREAHRNTHHFTFRTNKFSSKKEKKLMLFDCQEETVWSISHVAAKSCLDVRRGKMNSPCYTVPYISYHNNQFQALANNRIDGKIMQTGMDGSISLRNARFWIDMGCLGPNNRILAAQIVAPSPSYPLQPQQFILEIQPGVDTAFILSFLFAHLELTIPDVKKDEDDGDWDCNCPTYSHYYSSNSRSTSNNDDNDCCGILFCCSSDSHDRGNCCCCCCLNCDHNNDGWCDGGDGCCEGGCDCDCGDD